MSNNTEKAIKYLSRAARFSMKNLRENPGAVTKGRTTTTVQNNHGQGMKELQTAAKPPLGWIWGDFFQPWHRKFPSEPHFNRDAHLRRDYPPLSLIELQRLIDLGWLDASRPIDLTQLCRTHQFSCSVASRQFGVQLTDEGADDFVACVNIEVQFASDMAIAAVERQGGRISSAYYDPRALDAVVAPHKLFASGRPIPPRLPPPSDLVLMYSDPVHRGYLCSEKELDLARFATAQKYGYVLPSIDADSPLTERKPSNQCFFGLEAGWLVNTVDRTVMKPESDEVKEYYSQRVVQ